VCFYPSDAFDATDPVVGPLVTSMQSRICQIVIGTVFFLAVAEVNGRAVDLGRIACGTAACRSVDRAPAQRLLVARCGLLIAFDRTVQIVGQIANFDVSRVRVPSFGFIAERPVQRSRVII